MTDERSMKEQTGSWNVESLVERQTASGAPYLEFLRVPDLSVGLYVLEAGATDRQSPHTEDEVYVIVAGRARLKMGSEDVEVGSGSVAFVAAGIEHRFHDIVERLVILVVFGPAEASRARATA